MKRQQSSKTLIFVLIAVDVLLLLITLGVVFFQGERVKRIYTQQAAERWENEDMPYSEVSVFYGDTKKADDKTVAEIRSGIMTKLSADSYLDASDTSGKRTFIDAYAGSKEMTVTRDVYEVKGNIYGVSDDFFLIHNIPLLDGSYINPVEKRSETGEGRDYFQIVLDENMAWNLFGSVDVEGMKVTIDGKTFTVMGVVEAFQSDAEKMAYGNYDAAFIPYKVFSVLNKDEVVPIKSYEAVLPNPISNYAYNTLCEALGMGENAEAEEEENRSVLSFGDFEVIENTDRYKIPALYKYGKNKKYETMRTTSISYPYWENVARFEVEHAYKIFRLCIFLLILPFLSVIALFIWLYHKRGVVFNARNKKKLLGLAEELKDGIVDKFRKKEEENYDDDPEEDEDADYQEQDQNK